MFGFFLHSFLKDSVLLTEGRSDFGLFVLPCFEGILDIDGIDDGDPTGSKDGPILTEGRSDFGLFVLPDFEGASDIDGANDGDSTGSKDGLILTEGRSDFGLFVWPGFEGILDDGIEDGEKVSVEGIMLGSSGFTSNLIVVGLADGICVIVSFEMFINLTTTFFSV